jgi:hypothetical protein
LLERLQERVNYIFDISSELEDVRAFEGLAYLVTIQIFDDYWFLKPTFSNKQLIERIQESFEDAEIINEQRVQGTSPDFSFYKELLKEIKNVDPSPERFIRFLKDNTIIVDRHGAFGEYRELIDMGLKMAGGGRRKPVYRIKPFDIRDVRKQEISQGLGQYLNLIINNDITITNLYFGDSTVFIGAKIEFDVTTKELKNVIDDTINMKYKEVQQFMNRRRKEFRKILEQEPVFADYKQMKWNYYGNHTGAILSVPTQDFLDLKTHYKFNPNINHGWIKTVQSMEDNILKNFKYSPSSYSGTCSKITFFPEFNSIPYDLFIDKVLEATERYRNRNQLVASQ